MPNFLGLFASSLGAGLMQQAQASEQATNMSGLLGEVAAADPQTRGPTLLEGLIRNNPALAAKYGGQLAEIYQQNAELARQNAAKVELDTRMAGLNEVWDQTPPEKRPEVVARMTNTWGPKFTEHFLGFVQQQQRQQDSMTQIYEHGRQQTQSQGAQVDLARLQSKLSMDELTARERIRASGAAQAGMGGGIPGAQMGSVPQGTMMVQDTPNSVPRIVPLQGSDQQKAIQKDIDTAAKGLISTNSLIKLLSAHGTEFTGEIPAEMRVHLSNVITSLGQMGNSGVMNVGDVERHSNTIGNPTAFTSQFNPFEAGNIIAALKSVRAYQKNQLDLAHRNARGVPGTYAAPPIDDDEVVIKPGHMQPPARTRMGKF